MHGATHETCWGDRSQLGRLRRTLPWGDGQAASHLESQFERFAPMDKAFRIPLDPAISDDLSVIVGAGATV